MQEAGHSPSRLSHYGDVAVVPSKGSDVLLDPLQGQDLVVEAHVARDLVALQGEEAEGAQAIVDGDQDHALIQEVVWSIEPTVVRSYAEGATCNQ